MFRLHSAPQPATLRLLQQILRDQQILTEVRRDQLGVTAGMVPFTETWAELWYVDGDVEKAKRIVADFVSGEERAADEPEWRCEACGESVEGSFDICWNCGTARGTAG